MNKKKLISKKSSINKKKSAVEPYWVKIQRLNEKLLINIKKNMPELEKLLKKISGDWNTFQMAGR
jgi:hypothetical protein